MVNRAVKVIKSLRKQVAEQQKTIERLNTQLKTCQTVCSYYKDQTERLSLDLGLKEK